MSNQTTDTATQTSTRVFKIGAVRIVEDSSMAGRSNSEIQQLLKPLYPQVENATLRERIDEESGLTVVEFIPRPGRKG
jgi:hypothetical protein